MDQNQVSLVPAISKQHSTTIFEQLFNMSLRCHVVFAFPLRHGDRRQRGDNLLLWRRVLLTADILLRGKQERERCRRAQASLPRHAHQQLLEQQGGGGRHGARPAQLLGQLVQAEHCGESARAKPIPSYAYRAIFGPQISCFIYTIIVCFIIFCVTSYVLYVEQDVNFM